MLTFEEDPGYKGTARMLAESALCFVKEELPTSAVAGFHTPASAFGKTLMNRLVQTGCTFHFYNPYETKNEWKSIYIDILIYKLIK